MAFSLATPRGVKWEGGLAATGVGMDTSLLQYGLAKSQQEQQQQQWSDKLALYRDILGQQRQQTGGLSGAVNAYNKAFAEAQAANEAKFKQALGLVDQTSGQQAADIRSDYAKQRSSALQSLARTGMSGTTIGSTLSAGLQRGQSAALNRLADQMLERKTGIMQGFDYEAPEAGVTQSLIAALAPKYTFPSF